MKIERRTFIKGVVAGITAIGFGGITAIVPRLFCVWQMGTKCDGNVSNKSLFSGQIKIPICEKHFHEHLEITGMNEYGIDIDDILDMSSKQRRQIIKKKNIKLGSA